MAELVDAKLTDRRKWRGMARLHTGSNPVGTTKHKINIMIKLVRLKPDDKSFYVKMTKSFEFVIPAGHWLGVQDGKIYHSDDLVFLQDV